MTLRTFALALAASALLISHPAPALARDCEDICADLAAKNCENIDSVKCALYIQGCLSGCAVGKIIVWIGERF